MLKVVDADSRGVVEYIAGTEADVEDLPTELSQGSVCYVIETGALYMVDEETEEWKQL